RSGPPPTPCWAAPAAGSRAAPGPGPCALRRRPWSYPAADVDAGPPRCCSAINKHGDRVLVDPVTQLAQVGGDPRGAVPAAAAQDQPGARAGHRPPPQPPRRHITTGPLVEPGLRDPQRPAGHRVRHAVLAPLGGDKPGHGYWPIASCTQRATD